MTKVLIIEDDHVIGGMLTLYLAEESFAVHRTETGQDGLAVLQSFMPDIVLLDLMLPDMDGSDLCIKLREQSDIPIIIISMKTKVTEKIHALMAGADDFLSKPFSMQELKARIQTVLRRTKSYKDSDFPAAALVEAEDGIRIDPERRTVLLNCDPLETTFSEFEIMKLFVQHPGKVFSREELINAVRGIDSFINERAIDVHVTNLRKKIELNPKEPRFIKTVWGVGYKFMP
jgi:DNA-binding response OmpR family regulator